MAKVYNPQTGQWEEVVEGSARTSGVNVATRNALSSFFNPSHWTQTEDNPFSLAPKTQPPLLTNAREVVAGNNALPVVSEETPPKGNLSQAQIDKFWGGGSDTQKTLPVVNSTEKQTASTIPDILKNYDLQKEALETAYKANPATPFPEYRHPELPKIVDISKYRFNPRSYGGQLEAMSPGLATLDNSVARVIAGAGQGFTNRRLGALEQALKEGELARQHTQDVNANVGIENEFTKAKYDYDVGVRNESLARAMRSAGYPLDVIKATVEGLDKQADIKEKNARVWRLLNEPLTKPTADTGWHSITSSLADIRAARANLANAQKYGDPKLIASAQSALNSALENYKILTGQVYGGENATPVRDVSGLNTIFEDALRND